MDESNPLPRWLRLTLAGMGLFLAGGLLTFGYSYRPLHGAMTWKVEELERRIDDRNVENLKLGDELVRLRSMEASRIDPDTFSQIERELRKTKKALAQAEKDLTRTDRKRKDANASAGRWRKRYEELRDQQALATAQPAPPHLPAAVRPAGEISAESPTQPHASPASASPASLGNGMLFPDPTTTSAAPAPAP
jgi:hypothetical protein